MRCCAVLCRAASFAVFTLSFEVSYQVPKLLILHKVCAYYIEFVEPQEMHSQLSSAQLYVTQQPTAVRCRTLPCPAVRCCTVLRCALFRTCKKRCRYVRVFSYFSSLPLIVAVLFMPPPPPPANCTRTADQHVASPTSTQHITRELVLH